MAEEERPNADRPRQVTVGAWVAGGCSAAMLLVVGTVMGRLRSVDFQEGLTDFLRQQRDAGLSLSADQATTFVRIGLMVVGAVSAAMLVFAFFAARRDRSARIAMTVLAVPMLVCGIFVDPFLAGFVVAATVLLWTGPATDWFAGRTPRPAVADAPRPSPFGSGPDRASVDLDRLPPPQPPQQPQPAAADRPAPPPHPSWPATPVGPPSPSRRPGRLLVGCLLAGVLSAGIGVLMVATAVVIRTDAGRRELERVLADNPASNPGHLTVDQLATASAVMAGLLAVWALVAVVLAGLALAGRVWARWALVGSSVLAAVGGLLGVLAFPGFLVVCAAGVLCAVLLLHPDVTAWYAARRTTSAPHRPTHPW